MGILKRSTIGVLAVLALCAAALGAWAASGSASDVAALAQADQDWGKAYNAGQVDALAGLYAEDAVLMPPDTAAVHGRTAIRAYFVSDTAAAKQAGLLFHIGPHPDGGAVGDWGWSSGTYSVTDKAGHTVDAGKYLSVSRKQGGKWLYVRDIWNSDAAPAAAPAATTKK